MSAGNDHNKRTTRSPTKRTPTKRRRTSSAAQRTRGARPVSSRKRTRESGKRPGFGKIIALVAMLALIAGAVFALNAALNQVDVNKINACEKWRSTVQEACKAAKLDDDWTDALLALMAVESGGNVDVESVEGVSGDIMQAAEGAFGDIVKEGSVRYGVSAQTPEASVYAGVLEFKQNYDLWSDYLGGIEVDEPEKIQLIVQGYNFGADGWYSWCKQNKIASYSVETAQEYSRDVMPEDAKGTPTHAEKWLGFYEKLRS